MTKPMLTPAQAAVLLDQVVLERVADCIDFDRLISYERLLGLMLVDINRGDADQAIEAARAMMTTALRTIAENPEPFDTYRADASCALCEAEIRRESRHAITSRAGGS